MRVGECRRGRGCRRRCTGRRAMAYRDQVVGDDAGTDREYRAEHRQQRLEEGHCREDVAAEPVQAKRPRSEEHTSELQSLMRISYAVFCLKKKNTITEMCINTQEQEILRKT